MAAVCSFATAGAIVLPTAVAFAEDPPPGAPIIRTSDRGTVNAGPSTVVSAARGTAYSDGDDASKQQLIVNSDGSPYAPCYSNGQKNSKCGLP